MEDEEEEEEELTSGTVGVEMSELDYTFFDFIMNMKI